MDQRGVSPLPSGWVGERVELELHSGSPDPEAFEKRHGFLTEANGQGTIIGVTHTDFPGGPESIVLSFYPWRLIKGLTLQPDLSADEDLDRILEE